MTMPAPRLVRLPAADQDRRALPQGRPAVDETLVAARRPAANYTDRLKLVDDLGDRDHFGVGPDGPHDPFRAIHRLGFHGAAVVRAHRVQPGVAGIEMRLEDLDVLASNHRPSYPTDQLFALPGKHHAGNDFDPAGAGTVEHG